jgi:hypothetical protein
MRAVNVYERLAAFYGKPLNDGCTPLIRIYWNFSR